MPTPPPCPPPPLQCVVPYLSLFASPDQAAKACQAFLDACYEETQVGACGQQHPPHPIFVPPFPLQSYLHCTGHCDAGRLAGVAEGWRVWLPASAHPCPSPSLASPLILPATLPLAPCAGVWPRG